MAVCLKPGTELAFVGDVECLRGGFLFWRRKLIKHKTAIFRQINQDDSSAHHDALEFPDGAVVLVTSLCECQQATVLRLPVNARAAAPEPAQRLTPHLTCRMQQRGKARLEPSVVQLLLCPGFCSGTI
jgi:hypothetical protein